MLTYAACHAQLKRQREMEAGQRHTDAIGCFHIISPAIERADVVVMFITDNYGLDSASNVSLHLSLSRARALCLLSLSLSLSLSSSTSSASC